MNIINEFFVSFILIKLYFKFKVCRKIKFPLLWKFYFSKWKFYFSADIKQECQIEFDLLYDMLGLSIALKREWKNPLLYIHQGGISGNSSMLERYIFKYCKDK